jgi:hypothetical protein
MNEQEILEQALARARNVLATLEYQAAGYTSLTIPAHLKVELEEKRRDVANLGTRLKQLRDSGVVSIAEIKPNPFGDTGCITDASRFFGREELLRQVFEELDKGVNLSLVGEAQTGKSSLLNRIKTQGEERSQLPGTLQSVFVYLNLQWVDNEDDFYEALCEKLGILNCRGYKLTRALQGKRYVLCLDEIEKMTWDGFTKNLRSQLRGLADGGDAPLKLVIASRSPLAHLFPDSPELDSPLAGICYQLDVKPFSEEVVRAFVIHRLQGTAVRFSEEDIARLFAETKGHPAKLQRAAADLYRRKVMSS